VAQEPDRRRGIRFVDGGIELCEVVSIDSEGVVLRLDRVPRPVKFAWWQIDPEDAREIRGGGRATPPLAEGGTVPGIRVRTREGGVFEGVPVPGAPEGDVWIRNAEGRTALKAEQVVSREEVALPLARVYSPEEIFRLFAGRIRPSTPEEFERLGAELVRARMGDRAGALLRMAELLRHPDRPPMRLYRDLGRLRDLLEDLALRQAVAEAQESGLAGDYDRVLERLEAVERGLPASPPAGVEAELRRLRNLVQEMRGADREERIVQEWHRTTEVLLKARAMDPKGSFREASEWVERALPEEVERQVRGRFNFTPGDPEIRRAWERRSQDAVRKHAVGSGSWIWLEPGARDREEWWRGADAASRYGVLMGLAVERHFQVVACELKSCPACGGGGRVEGPSSSGDLCATCLGTKSLRVLIYR